jgi:hypothetical protein
LIRSITKGLLLAAALGLGGCAAHDYKPVAMVQPGDDAMSCSDISKQMADNETAAAAFIRADKRVETGNTIKTVGSAIPYLGILIAASNDLSNEEQAKARALIDRNERLSYLAKQKGCSP